MSRFDALVIGGGPAGSTAAIALARAGWSVALVEKARFPRAKVCGEYISATTWPVLEALGIGDSLARVAGPCIERVGLYAADTAIEAPMPAPGESGMGWGHAIGRDILDAALLGEALRSGAAIWQPWAVAAVRAEGEGHVAVLSEARTGAAREIESRLVIDAHGSWERSPLASCAARDDAKAGDLFGFKARFAGARLPPGLMPLVLFPGGYGGMVHTDAGEVSFSCCVRRDALRAMRARAPGSGAGDCVVAHVMRTSRAAGEALAPARRAAPWLSAGPIRPGIRTLARDGVFAVGNAAGEAHPLVAEGISMAIQSAWILAMVLAPHVPATMGRRAIRAAEREYASRWRDHLATRIRAASLFAALTSRPSGARAGAGAIARCPSLLTWGAQWSGKARTLEAPRAPR